MLLRTLTHPSMLLRTLTHPSMLLRTLTHPSMCCCTLYSNSSFDVVAHSHSSFDVVAHSHSSFDVVAHSHSSFYVVADSHSSFDVVHVISEEGRRVASDIFLVEIFITCCGVSPTICCCVVTGWLKENNREDNKSNGQLTLCGKRCRELQQTTNDRVVWKTIIAKACDRLRKSWNITVLADNISRRGMLSTISGI